MWNRGKCYVTRAHATHYIHIFSPLLGDLGAPPTGLAGGRSRRGGGERELEGLGCGVVVERESVGVNDGGGDGGEVVVVERSRGGAAGAVNGGARETRVQ